MCKTRVKASNDPRQESVQTSPLVNYTSPTLAILAISFFFILPLHPASFLFFLISLHHPRCLILDELVLPLHVSHYDALCLYDILRSARRCTYVSRLSRRTADDGHLFHARQQSVTNPDTIFTYVQLLTVQVHSLILNRIADITAA